MSHYLGYEFIDAAEVIFFDENGTFLSEKTNEELSERLAHTERAVIPGFYGSNPTARYTPSPAVVRISLAPS